MLDVKNVSNNDEFFADTPTTPEESVELCRKQQCLKEVINKRKAYLLGVKKQWTFERVDQARNKTINYYYTK